jgi:copper oxidase (laccase) domain-containing protein
VLIHAVGDVKTGFSFQIKRSHNFEITRTFPTKRISLQWVDGKDFNEQAMLNNGVHKIDNRPVCAFEASAYKVQPPGKSLNTIDEASFMSFLAMAYTS